MLNNEGLLKRHIAGKEEAWLLRSGIAAEVAQELMDMRSS